ncbi:MAG TPA: hydrogenase maturation nickel metallochaperone HypA [Firmicutes bacterium]|nr:hydrogenase maturation nickel metallochaperone HypA [Bacillota bacterium]
MHELSIALSMVELVQAEVAKRGLSKVSEVKVVVGELSNVVPDALEFCWEVATQETPAAGSKLVIEHRPVTARCHACGQEFTVQEYHFLCPKCGSGDTEQTGGSELYIDHILAD